jgi:type IV secretion system protein VirB3
MDGQLNSDPLFVGLTRPTLIFGVSILYCLLNMMISITCFIQTSSIKVLVVSIIVHIFGYILCFKEPLFMEIALNKASKCNKCSNKTYYGANSYYV